MQNTNLLLAHSHNKRKLTMSSSDLVLNKQIHAYTYNLKVRKSLFRVCVLFVLFSETMVLVLLVSLTFSIFILVFHNYLTLTTILFCVYEKNN